jgi:hypothetical protein
MTVAICCSDWVVAVSTFVRRRFGGGALLTVSRRSRFLSVEAISVAERCFKELSVL